MFGSYNLPIAMQLAWFTCDIFSILTQTDEHVYNLISDRLSQLIF